MKRDIVRVLRVIEYIGPRNLVETCVHNSIHGTKIIDAPTGKYTITAVTVYEFPQTIVVKEKKKRIDKK